MNDFKLIDNVFKYENDSNFEIVISSNLGGKSTGKYSSLNLGLHVDDVYDNVILNRKKYATDLNKDLEKFVYMQQTHSKNVKQVSLDDAAKGLYNFDDGIKDCDAIYTFSDELILNSMCADCTPVYFYSDNDNLKGIIHAGWQGTLKEITYFTLKEIISKHNIDPSNLNVVIGPSISVDSFEVDEDVFNMFVSNELINEDNYFKNGIKYHIDIKKINMQQAASLGISNIFVSSIDTYETNELYSFRKNNVTGRMCATIYTKDN